MGARARRGRLAGVPLGAVGAGRRGPRWSPVPPPNPALQRTGHSTGFGGTREFVELWPAAYRDRSAA